MLFYYLLPFPILTHMCCAQLCLHLPCISQVPPRLSSSWADHLVYELAEHPPVILTSAFLCLPFCWLPPLPQQLLPFQSVFGCDKK